ncbi:MAG: endonuclease/exonuclease/phosphatase family protein [Fimbriimonadaceae bacterium]|nr:endonuclease/exonuclease/phosphatase family protein [Fimbriimonadaceae bacterium]
MFVPIAMATTLLTAHPAAPMEAQVMSYNIRFATADDGENRWERRRATALAMLGERAPHIVGLQEALRSQLDEIRQALPWYVEVGVGRDDGLTKGEYSALLVDARRFAVASSGTFWLSDTPEKVGSVTWGNRITRVCTWARLIETRVGRGFWVFNVHLDHESQNARERSVRLVLARIRGRGNGEPFLFLGDFNAGEQNPAYREAVAAEDGVGFPMRDPFREVHPSRRDVLTFHGFQGGRDGEKIDHILASSEWEVLDADILRPAKEGAYVSDHYPVWAKLRLP